MIQILLEHTIQLICKNQQEVDNLFIDGWILKEIKEIKYLVKYTKEN